MLRVIPLGLALLDRYYLLTWRILWLTFYYFLSIVISFVRNISLLTYLLTTYLLLILLCFFYRSSHRRCFVSKPSKHINVKSTLKQRWSSTFINVVSTWKFGWKWKLSQRMFIDVFSTLTEQRWNNVDRVTLIQCRWPNVVSTLVLGWKGKLSQRMFIGVEKTALKQLCQYFLYWGSLESGSIIKQN